MMREGRLEEGGMENIRRREGESWQKKGVKGEGKGGMEKNIRREEGTGEGGMEIRSRRGGGGGGRKERCKFEVMYSKLKTRSDYSN